MMDTSPRNFRFSILKKTTVVLVSTLMFLMSGIVTASGQQVEASDARTEVGVHAGPAITTLGPGLHAGIAVQHQQNQFTLRTVSTDMEYGKETWEIAFLYGRTFPLQPFQLSFGAGMGVVGGTRYTQLAATSAGKELEPMMGFPLQAQILWSPVRFVDVAINGFANVNTGQPLGGMSVTLGIGRFR